MPIDKLMAQYLPDTTPAFKSWIAGGVGVQAVGVELQADGV